MPLNCTPFKMVKWPILCYAYLTTKLSTPPPHLWLPCRDQPMGQGWLPGAAGAGALVMLVEGLDRLIPGGFWRLNGRVLDLCWTWRLGARDGECFHLGHVKLEVPAGLQVKLSSWPADLGPWRAAHRLGPETSETHKHVAISIRHTTHFSKRTISWSLVFVSGMWFYF